MTREHAAFVAAAISTIRALPGRAPPGPTAQMLGEGKPVPHATHRALAPAAGACTTPMSCFDLRKTQAEAASRFCVPIPFPSHQPSYSAATLIEIRTAIWSSASRSRASPHSYAGRVRISRSLLANLRGPPGKGVPMSEEPSTEHALCGQVHVLTCASPRRWVFCHCTRCPALESGGREFGSVSRGVEGASFEDPPQAQELIKHFTQEEGFTGLASAATAARGLYAVSATGKYYVVRGERSRVWSLRPPVTT